MPAADRYASFLLRMQWMENENHPTWIVSLQRTGSSELHWFPNMEALIQFLRTEFGTAVQPGGYECETGHQGDTRQY